MFNEIKNENKNYIMPSWNKRHNDRLLKFEKLIYNRIKLNKLSAEYYEKRNGWLGYPIVIIGALATSTSSIINPISNDKGNYLPYISGGLTLLMTIMTGFKTISKYEKKINQHKNAIAVYKKLAIEIDIQKDLEYVDRNPVDIFMKSIKDKFGELEESTPSIPSHIEKIFDIEFDEYIKNLKKTGELSESSEHEEKIKKKIVKVLNEETGQHILTEIIISEKEEEKEKEEDKEDSIKMYNIEKQIDSLTKNNSFCNYGTSTIST